MNGHRRIFFPLFSRSRSRRKKRNPFSSLRLTVLLLAGLPVIFTLAASLYLNVRQDQQQLTRNYLEQGHSFLSYVADLSKIPLLEQDYPGLQAIIQGINALEAIEAAWILDNEGRVVVSSGKYSGAAVQGGVTGPEQNRGFNGVLEKEHRVPEDPLDFSFSQDIQHQNAILGSVHFVVSRQNLEHGLRTLFRSRLSGILSVGIILLAFSTIAALGVIVNERKYGAQLLNGLRKLRQGQYGYAIHPVSTSRHFEILHEFNKLSRHLLENTVERSGLQQLFSSAKVQEKERVPGIENESTAPIVRAQVTVLYASIKGFKDHAESADPQKTLENLNEFFEIASKRIRGYGGYVDRFIGDAVISVFVPSTVQADHRKRAVRAAVGLHNSLKKKDHLRNEFLKQVGIGISSGVVLSGKIGAQDKKQDGFIGESFNVAYSLNLMASPGDIIISEDVGRFLESEMAVEPLPPREIIEKTDSWVNFRLKHLAQGSEDV